MEKFLTILVMALCLSGCDSLGSTKVKNLIDLTSKLEVEEAKNPLFSTGSDDSFNEKKAHSYTISKKPIIAEPAIAKGVIYSIDKGGYVSAFSLKEKKLLWTKDIARNEPDRDFNYGGVLFSDGKLYITYGSRNLIIMDAASGNEIIRKEFPDVLKGKAAMADDAVLLAQTISNQLVAYNVKTSRMLWMHEGGIEVISARNHISPLVYNGHALVSYSSGDVVWLDARNGTEVWRYSLTNSDSIGLPSFDPAVIITKPVISDNFAYFAASNGRIIKLDIRDGKEIWARNAEDVQSITLHDNNLIITNNARQVAILSTASGRVNWVGNLISAKERQSKKPKALVFLNPFVIKEGSSYSVNVIASSGELYRFRADAAGSLSSEPLIIPIDKNIRYYTRSCCGNSAYIILDTKVKF